jgi:hypothetical protein
MVHQVGFGYVVEFMRPNGNCLFQSLCTLGAARGIRLTIPQARAIAANAYTIDQVENLRLETEPNGEESTEVYKYLQKRLKNQFHDDPAYLAAYKNGMLSLLQNGSLKHGV